MARVTVAVLSGSNWRTLGKRSLNALMNFASDVTLPTKVVLEPYTGVQRAMKESVCKTLFAVCNSLYYHDHRLMIVISLAHSV